MGGTSSWHPLSHGQEALWFLWKLAPESWAYNLVVPVGVRGELDLAAFRRAWQRLSDRHPGLRMELREEGGRPSQRAIADHPVDLAVVDAAGWSDERVDEAVRAAARRPFDLEQSAALRVTLLRRAVDHHLLVVVVHHIVSDLWSLIVLMDELRAAYAAETGKGPWDPPPLPLDYADHARAERRMLDGKQGEELWRYWQGELAGELPALDLPADRSRPPMQTFNGGTVMRRIDTDVTRRLQQLAGSEASTPYMILLAAFQVLLHRYSGQDDVLVGTPTAGRGRPELGGVIGDFVNIVPLRADLRGAPSFRALLVQVRNKVIGAIGGQEYPFSLLVDRLQPARDLSRSPIFQASFVLQKFHRFPELARSILPGDDEPPIPFGPLTLEAVPLAQQDGQFDLSLEVKIDERGRLLGAWKYAADLFDAATVERLADSFETLLRDVADHPERSIAELRLLSDAESRQAIVDGEGAEIALPAAATVERLFAARATAVGDAVALGDGAAVLSYAALDRRVAACTRALAARGVGPETLVAVSMPRGFDFVTALLAVGRAGGAFLPLDPRHPLPRTAEIVARSGALLVLTTAELAGEARRALGDGGPRVTVFGELTAAATGAALPAVDGSNLAYVMYTSGSTGAPKGVMVVHRGMVNHVLAKLSDLGMDGRDALAQNGPQSFDIVVWQCLAPLVVGGRAEVIADGAAEDPAELLAAVEARRVTVLQLVPSMLRATLEEARERGDAAPARGALRYMVPTGEALPTELCRRWFELFPAIPILNTYGSTECSDDQCHYPLRELAPADGAVAVTAIGTAVQNLSAHVLDHNLAPVPAGVVGELYIGGVGVGRGYRDDPARTAAAFVPDPHGRVAAARLYRTRDLARRRRDGVIDFVGRIDHMIKLRGFRIEPGEIEAALGRHPAVAAAAVVARDHPAGDRRLVAYVVAASDAEAGAPDADELRRFLAGRLPQYMVPSTFRALDALPLTANGKLDQRRLPAPEWQTAPAAELVEPRTATEATIAAIWAEVLGRERVGVTESFFAVGGDSIRSIQIVARCKRAGLDLRPTDLFLHQTVEALAAHAAAQAPATAGTETAAPTLDLPAISQEHLDLAFGQVEFDEDPEPALPRERR